VVVMSISLGSLLFISHFAWNPQKRRPPAARRR